MGMKSVEKLLSLTEKDFHILYTSLRDGRNYAPSTSPGLFLFVEEFLRSVGDEVETFQGKVDRRTYAEILKESRKKLKRLAEALHRSPYRALLHLLPKDIVAFLFFMEKVFPLLIASGASPSAVERLTLFLKGMNRRDYFKALRFLHKYLKAYGSPSLALIISLLSHMDWSRWPPEGSDGGGKSED